MPSLPGDILSLSVSSPTVFKPNKKTVKKHQQKEESETKRQTLKTLMATMRSSERSYASLTTAKEPLAIHGPLRYLLCSTLRGFRSAKERSVSSRCLTSTSLLSGSIWLSERGEDLFGRRGESGIGRIWLVPMLLATVVLSSLSSSSSESLSVLLELLMSWMLLLLLLLPELLDVDWLWPPLDEEFEEEEEEEEEGLELLLEVVLAVRLKAEEVVDDAEEGERREDEDELTSDTLAERELAEWAHTTGYRMLPCFGSTGTARSGPCVSSARLHTCSLSTASRASRVRAVLGSDAEVVVVVVGVLHSPASARGREAVLSRLEQHVLDMAVFRACA